MSNINEIIEFIPYCTGRAVEVEEVNRKAHTRRTRAGIGTAELEWCIGAADPILVLNLEYYELVGATPSDGGELSEWVTPCHDGYLNIPLGTISSLKQVSYGYVLAWRPISDEHDYRAELTIRLR